MNIIASSLIGVLPVIFNKGCSGAGLRRQFQQVMAFCAIGQ
jgi:hypothetical protein